MVMVDTVELEPLARPQPDRKEEERAKRIGNLRVQLQAKATSIRRHMVAGQPTDEDLVQSINVLLNMLMNDEDVSHFLIPYHWMRDGFVSYTLLAPHLDGLIDYLAR